MRAYNSYKIKGLKNKGLLILESYNNWFYIDGDNTFKKFFCISDIESYLECILIKVDSLDFCAKTLN